ncbi:nucleoside triphosphate pyrophosphohydrolase [Serpentinicella sp. ANB-PHB4]|uniref:nucleoside triphosphate pyrophosphohydrolase n=1 Tax=Serpentinicella sp. ANB-PHB4 TaxID=3074076 RepID=UPI0028593FEB|nr:nucleoside triphosphate pyrophosphohydrolase [Serpentinicella sp. ANB-PHB4]MDR5659250.1 nucleoside triphosphate pyrophosphohydrolase [Serpentinicella sp. ANB-PHB4]
MAEKIYNKLVRDRIPEIIQNHKKTCETTQVAGQELQSLLNQKLQEEVEEFLQSGDLEELADILEVIHGILQYRGTTFKELEVIRLKKKEERGGFEKGIKLIKVKE